MFVSLVCTVRYIHNELDNQLEAVTLEQLEGGNIPDSDNREHCGDSLVTYLNPFIPGIRCGQAVWRGPDTREDSHRLVRNFLTSKGIELKWGLSAGDQFVSN